jgi:serine/threonine protein phosphatase PrpC
MSECCTPSLTRWPLLPGDVIVLCTDGLVEEGFFLEPSHVAEIVRANKDRPAAQLALMLVEAADALQRVPSIVEPDGFGDNISSVVIKITQ